MNSVLVGMFDTQASAAQARNRLIEAGFSEDAATMTGGQGGGSNASPPSSSSSSNAVPEHEGAISRFFNSIFGESNERDDDERAGYTDTYNEAFKRGSYGVSVTTASDSEMDKAEDILNDCGAVDIDEQAATWRKDGWTGSSAGVMSAAGQGSRKSRKS